MCHRTLEFKNWMAEITRCLRFHDRPEKKAHAQNKIAPIRAIFDKWAIRLKSVYLPGANVTVDEQLLPYPSRSPFTFIFKRKNIFFKYLKK